MAWSVKQKQLAVRACKATGISEEHRRVILGGPAFNSRAIYKGRPTSTSPRLTNCDFEIFMEFIESQSPAKCITLTGGPPGSRVVGFPVGHFARQAGDSMARMRTWLTRAVIEPLARAHIMDDAGLRGWIRDRVCEGQPRTLEDLDWPELNALTRGLIALAKRRGVAVGVDRREHSADPDPGREVPF